MELWQLYLITILDGISNATSTVMVITFAVMAFGTILVGVTISDTYCEDRIVEIKAIYFKYLKMFVAVFIVAGFCNIVTPTTDQAYTIVGAYYATNIENIDKLPPNIVDAANQFLEQYTDGASSE